MRKYLSVLLILVLVVTLAMVAAPALPLKAATTWNVPGDADNITDAIAMASAGDTINVAPGAYNENVVVNKQLRIIGAGAGSTTVTANVTSLSVFVVTPTGNSTTIKNFTITGATTVPAIVLTGGGNTIDSNNITGNYNGISIRSGENRIIRNTIANNSNRGIHYNFTERSWNQVEYNDIYGNTNWGVYAEPMPGDSHWKHNTGFNYWGDVSGPSAFGPGTGDKVNEYVWFNPWLNTNQSTILSTGIANISIAVRLKVGWNTLATPLPMAGDSNQWSEIVTNSSLTYDAAYTYDRDTGFSLLASGNATFYLDPLEAVVIKVSSPTWVTLKVSTEVHPPGTRELKQGWNLMGSAMAITERELEMWKVLKSVNKTASGLTGYITVISPPLASQPSWVYVRGQEETSGFEWEKMDFGRGYWIYMENPDEMASFSSTPITARIWE
ncbi:nitrous oxide reductase family maturation protein NosD [Chloroflexota bacterium]